ncbi:MAG: hypothetical protein A2827_01900 [Candidatus Spechtbacteria bacterium RIFCSPHIGHO2_01_FULL_43_30]|uniref:VanZ-like domain-containing protein n=1 Tax=Candidatus Spechtbacteria bacterium RIFCSPHIGHO2_01_FULL_43_30 TaxID=1802158 RepID=A0A1G2H7I7_9BACT|nr:MAG: hypothetical protein A2827_01900 [Candidatus Spechtbacteria bacterium RIFCSPHIGHO2_01_FULL_43_30]
MIFYHDIIYTIMTDSRAAKLYNFFISNSGKFFWVFFLLTFFGLFTPSAGEQSEIYNLDILVHYIMFAAFCTASIIHFGNKNNSSAIGILLILALFIPASEFIQENFVVGRGYEFTDILSGYAGILSAYLVTGRGRSARSSANRKVF